MSDKEVTTGDLLDFMKENMATKEDLYQQDLKMGAMELRMLDQMDRKLVDFKGDLIVLMRGEDKKLCSLVELLREKKVLTEDEAGSILAMQPFPQQA